MASKRITEGFTESDRDEFRQIKTRDKIECMELYLIGKNQCQYNMEEVAESYYRDKNYSYTVSLIHRGYNFSGQNKGRYRNGCKFEKSYGHRVTRKDIEDFIKTYPQGTFQKYVKSQDGTKRLYTFEDFLLERLKQSQSSKKYTSSETVRQKLPQSSMPVENSTWESEPRPQPQLARQDNKKGEDDVSSISSILFLIGVVCVIILIIMLIRGAVGKHLLFSGILLLIAICGIRTGLHSMNSSDSGEAK